MAWMRCRSCTALFAIGLLRCPQCQAVSELYARPDYEDGQEEADMPKITIAGASNALEAREPGAVVAEAPAADAVQPAAEPDEVAPDAAEDAAGTPEPEPAAVPVPKKRAAKKTAAALEA